MEHTDKVLVKVPFVTLQRGLFPRVNVLEYETVLAHDGDHVLLTSDLLENGVPHLSFRIEAHDLLPWATVRVLFFQVL
jgi:hypothetical protein